MAHNLFSLFVDLEKEEGRTTEMSKSWKISTGAEVTTAGSEVSSITTELSVATD